MTISYPSANNAVISNGPFTLCYSYATLIAIYDNVDGILYFTSKKYSNATSRHLGKFVDSLPIDFRRKEITQENLENCISLVVNI